MRYNIIDQIFHLKSVCISKEENIRKELGLSPAEFRGIMAMVQGSDIPCSLLSRKMGLSISRGSRVTDKLLKGGYLKLTRNESDKRV
ncbi:MAG: helix-turn-helix domain-containing protein, partial [Ignavibacteria bacterium]